MSQFIPSPTREHVLTIPVDDNYEGQEVLRILFTGDSQFTNYFSQRLLVWERDYERYHFLKYLPQRDLSEFPNPSPDAWNLGFPPTPDTLARLMASPTTKSYDWEQGVGYEASLRHRFPTVINRSDYPGPRFISILSDGWWRQRELPQECAYHPYAPDLSYRPYAFWVEDCFDPPVYVIFAEDEQEAYEQAVDWFSDYDSIRIDERDYADYLSDEVPTHPCPSLPVGFSPRSSYKFLLTPAIPDTPVPEEAKQSAADLFAEHYEGSFDSNGNPVDVESLRMEPLRILSIDWS